MSYSFLYTAAALLGIAGGLPEHLPTPPPSDAPTLARPAAPRLDRLETPSHGPVAYTAHLASYFNEPRARLGWELLAARAPGLSVATPEVHHARVPDLGAVVRLTAGRFASWREADQFCARIRGAVGYCEPLPVAAAAGAGDP